MKKSILLLLILFICSFSYLLAGCAIGKCTVTFDTGGGTEIAAQKVSKGDRIQKPEEPEKAGYTFAGWTYQDEDWSFAGYMVSGDMTLTARWNVITYTVTYVLNGGSNASINPDTFTVESDTFTIGEPEKDGWAFVGWTWEGQSEPQKAVIVEKGTHESKTYTANWKLNGFIVSTDGILTLMPGIVDMPTEVEIPTVCGSISVTGIGTEAFAFYSDIKNIIIPGSVTSIGERAFYGCTNLNSIVFDGTQEEWNAIRKAENWGLNATCTVHCTDGDIVKTNSGSGDGPRIDPNTGEVILPWVP